MANYLLSIMSCSGALVSHPLATTVHANVSGEVLHFDYLFLDSVKMKNIYALVLIEHFSGYTCLSSTSQATALNTAEVLARWKTTFTTLQYWVFDQVPRFIDQLLQSMAFMHIMQHNPTVTYLLGVNGTVEWLNHVILAASRALRI